MPRRVEELSPGIEKLCVLEVNLLALLPEYDVPDERPEWAWIAEHASFAHKGNGFDAGVWEFMLYVPDDESCLPEAIPEVLKPAYALAREQGAKWLLCHQD